jgi:hypothetical protein
VPAALVGKKRNVFRVLMGKPEGKTQQGIPRYCWLDNVKIALREM